MRLSRIIIGIAVVMGLAAGIAAWLLEADVTGVPLSELEAEYATPDSRFMEVGGVRLHYMDQGAGPVVLLLHASHMNLRTWDSMAARLAGSHRVVRLDLLASGLTGPDPLNDYSLDRSRALTLGLMDRLGIDDFAVVGTSSGAIIAFRLAAENAGRISRLVLINSAGMPRSAATDPNRRARAGGIVNWILVRYTPRSIVRYALDMNFIEPHEPPEWLVDMTYDMWRRAGRREVITKQIREFRTGDPQATLAGVEAPTLILWGLDNATVMHLEADVFQHWLVNAPTILKKYPGVGHYLYLEIPGEVETDVDDFLSGRMDSRLIRMERRIGPG